MKGWKTTLAVVIAVAILAAGGAGYIRYRDARTPPEIVLWYSDQPDFGQAGLTQNQINILGNVYDPDGVTSLYYRFNSGPETFLSIGPDLRRLEDQGDFNIDLPVDELISGENQITLFAWDGAGNKSEKDFLFQFRPQKIGLPLEIDWAKVKNIKDVSSVIDGEWKVIGEGLQTSKFGYDRLIALGDLEYQNFDVVMRFRVDEVNPDGWDYPSGSPGVGLILRWQGHSDFPKAGWQPKSGWLPMGAITWIRWAEDLEGPSYQILEGNNGSVLVSKKMDKEPIIGVWYTMHAQVESLETGDSIYRMNVWKDEEDEPVGWMLEGQFPSVSSGSIGILAHEVMITVSETFVYPLTAR